MDNFVFFSSFGKVLFSFFFIPRQIWRLLARNYFYPDFNWIDETGMVRRMAIFIKIKYKISSMRRINS